MKFPRTVNFFISFAMYSIISMKNGIDCYQSTLFNVSPVILLTILGGGYLYPTITESCLQSTKTFHNIRLQ